MIHPVMPNTDMATATPAEPEGEPFEDVLAEAVDTDVADSTAHAGRKDRTASEEPINGDTKKDLSARPLPQMVPAEQTATSNRGEMIEEARPERTGIAEDAEELPRGPWQLDARRMHGHRAVTTPPADQVDLGAVATMPLDGEIQPIIDEMHVPVSVETAETTATAIDIADVVTLGENDALASEADIELPGHVNGIGLLTPEAEPGEVAAPIEDMATTEPAEMPAPATAPSDEPTPAAPVEEQPIDAVVPDARGGSDPEPIDVPVESVGGDLPEDAPPVGAPATDEAADGDGIAQPEETAPTPAADVPAEPTTDGPDIEPVILEDLTKPAPVSEQPPSDPSDTTTTQDGVTTEPVIDAGAGGSDDAAVTADEPAAVDVSGDDARQSIDSIEGRQRTDQGQRAERPAEAPIERRAMRLAERIEKFIDRAQNTPPPNVLTLRPDGADGFAIRVVLDGTSLHVSLQGARMDEVPWLQPALDRLVDQGFDLREGGTERGRREPPGDERNERREEQRPANRRRRRGLQL